jgi:hypothetical protein
LSGGIIADEQQEKAWYHSVSSFDDEQDDVDEWMIAGEQPASLPAKNEPR